MRREKHDRSEDSSSQQPLRIVRASHVLPTSRERAVAIVCHPGQCAPVSGIYRVIHNVHRAPHEVLILRGEELPMCRSCKLDVTFTLVEAVEHVTHDMDFAGPVLSWKKKKAA